MQWTKWFGIVSFVLLVVGCFLPWVYIDVLNMTINGVENKKEILYGPRGRANLFFSLLFFLFFLLGKSWSLKISLVLAAINLAFTAAHFFVYRCDGGICPQFKTGIYLTLAASIGMLLSNLFTPVPVSKEDDEE